MPSAKSSGAPDMNCKGVLLWVIFEKHTQKNTAPCWRPAGRYHRIGMKRWFSYASATAG